MGLVLAALVLTGVMLATHHSPKPLPASDQGHVPLAGPPVNPAQQPPGVSRQIERIAAAGNVIVTTGSQTTVGGVVRQQFFVSADGGATWYLAPIQWPGGGRPMAGHVAVRIAGGPRGWLAEGPQAIWTSRWPVVDAGGHARDRPAAARGHRRGHRDRGRLPGRRRDGERPAETTR